MRYRVVAVGRLTEPFYRAGCDHYLKRLKPFAPTELIEVRRGRGGDADVKREEGASLLTAAEGFTVALDEGGRAFSTAALAKHVSELELTGESRVSLLIGGASGHDQETLEAADMLLSLSPLTLPHELARLLLLEQLYRIETLRAGHPYHRE